MNMVLFCFAVFMLTVPIGLMWSIYPYSSGLFRGQSDDCSSAVAQWNDPEVYG